MATTGIDPASTLSMNTASWMDEWLPLLSIIAVSTILFIMIAFALLEVYRRWRFPQTVLKIDLTIEDRLWELAFYSFWFVGTVVDVLLIVVLQIHFKFVRSILTKRRNWLITPQDDTGKVVMQGADSVKNAQTKEPSEASSLKKKEDDNSAADRIVEVSGRHEEEGVEQRVTTVNEPQAEQQNVSDSPKEAVVEETSEEAPAAGVGDEQQGDNLKEEEATEQALATEMSDRREEERVEQGEDTLVEEQTLNVTDAHEEETEATTVAMQSAALGEEVEKAHDEEPSEATSPEEKEKAVADRIEEVSGRHEEAGTTVNEPQAEQQNVTDTVKKEEDETTDEAPAAPISNRDEDEGVEQGEDTEAEDHAMAEDEMAVRKKDKKDVESWKAVVATETVCELPEEEPVVTVHDLPHGPVKFFITGFSLINPREPHRTILKNVERYGAIHTIGLPNPIVVIARWEELYEIATLYAASGRPCTELFLRFMTHRPSGNGIILSSGETWERNRRFAAKFLKRMASNEQLNKEKEKEMNKLAIKLTGNDVRLTKRSPCRMKQLLQRLKDEEGNSDGYDAQEDEEEEKKRLKQKEQLKELLRRHMTEKGRLEEVIGAQADLLVARIEQCMERGESVIDLHDFLFHAVANVIFSIVFGKTYPVDDPLLWEIKHLLDEVLHYVQSPEMQSVDRHSWLRGRLPADKKYTKLGAMLEERFVAEINDNWVWYQESEEERAARTGNRVINPDNLVQEYFNSHKSDSDKISADDLPILVGDLVTGGLETTLSTIRWLIIYLVDHPLIQEQMNDEITKILPEKQPHYKHSHYLPFVVAAIEESLRLGNILPWSIPHRAMADITTKSGVTIPKGAIMMFSIAAIHHNPEYFYDPYSFIPERHLLEGGKLRRMRTMCPMRSATGSMADVEGHEDKLYFKKDDKCNPFGVGPRACVGKDVAYAELFCFTVSLLQRFRFSVVPGRRPSYKRPIGMTSAPPRFVVNVEKRDSWYEQSLPLTTPSQ